MSEYITYRLTGTGVWGYEFFDPEHNQIGFVRNALSRAEPVRRRHDPGGTESLD